MSGPLNQDRDRITDAYEDVRSDATDTSWMLLRYDEKNIILFESGDDYDKVLDLLKDDERMFAYARFQMGDEMSRRAKFALITWVGTSVSPMKRAKLSTDKALVKEVIKSFAVEIHTEEKSDLAKDAVRSALAKVGGANYGTGVQS